MDPIDTDTGVRMRLRNLHYLYDHRAPDLDVAGAIATFQRANGLSPETAGVVDDATRDALRRSHGC